MTIASRSASPETRPHRWSVQNGKEHAVLIAELNALLRAELDYAHFNARRTSGRLETESISISTISGASCITDSSRLDVEYYNRAVIHPEVSSLVDVLHDLPENIQAVELLIPQQNAESFECLADAGFSPLYSLCYLVSSPDRRLLDNSTANDFTVRELCADERDYFFDLLEMSGASFPRVKRDATQKFYCAAPFHCFVAFDSSDQPAGWATMYIREETAFLANAFTLPGRRRQGAHSALLSARLSMAKNLQVRRVFTDVAPASQSHQNCEKYGFRLLSVNNIWKRHSG